MKTIHDFVEEETKQLRLFYINWMAKHSTDEDRYPLVETEENKIKFEEEFLIWKANNYKPLDIGGTDDNTLSIREQLWLDAEKHPENWGDDDGC